MLNAVQEWIEEGHYKKEQKSITAIMQRHQKKQSTAENQERRRRSNSPKKEALVIDNSKLAKQGIVMKEIFSPSDLESV
jgi:hypothetical protein